MTEDMREHLEPSRRRFLRVVGLSAAAARAGMVGAAAEMVKSASSRFTSARSMPSLSGATEWINSPHITEASVRGKVVLVQFWTYTCINWLRTLPYVRGWADRYGSHGLVVIGVHSPEFEFERKSANVRRAVIERRIRYPVAVDSDLKIWRNFDNSYWPALYIVDAAGVVRNHHFGEGSYEATERALQQLLAIPDADRRLTDVDAEGVEAAADWSNLKSPENYLGQRRTQNFTSASGHVAGPHSYSFAGTLALNHWALSGQWTMREEACASSAAGALISDRFHARDVHLVMGPASRVRMVRFRVRLDGRPPGVAHGGDVDSDGNGVAIEQRLYHLVRQPSLITDRLLEIEFLDPGIEAFAFTFG